MCCAGDAEPKNSFPQTVPVMGAIMLSPGLDKCLLVKSWGSNGAWGFPRGKIATAETDAECAVREVRCQTLKVYVKAQGSVGRILCQSKNQIDKMGVLVEFGKDSGILGPFPSDDSLSSC